MKLAVMFFIGCFAFTGPNANAIVAQDSKVNSPLLKKMSADDSLRAMMLTSKAVRAAVKKIQPALVTIESYGGVSTIQGRIGGIRKQGEGNTTGVLISNNGHIITSTFNFVQRPPTITVITSDGQRRVAKLLAQDNIRKICLLKIEDYTGPAMPEMISPNDLIVGQWAISVGVGYGDTSPATSIGIISAKNRIGGRAIQTDANISPANYGGPLLDIEGRLIGICVPLNPQSQAVGAGVEWYDSGIGFAIPLADADKLLNRLKNGISRYPAFLGVRCQPSPDGTGAWIDHVAQKSPADKAGMLRGDIIIGINDVQIVDVMKLMQELSKFSAGDTIKITFSVEGKKEKSVTIELAKRPAASGLASPLEPRKSN